MPKKCILCDKSDEKWLDLSFHRFPTDPNKRELWREIIDLNKEKILSKWACLCSDHFDPQYVRLAPTGRHYLVPNALPKSENFEFLSSRFLATFHLSNAGFLYGQPCSERNTAYLFPDRWSIPENTPTNCVDITGFQTTNLINPGDFFSQVSTADTLYADHMNLTRFPTSMVHSLPHIETLDLSGNLIKRIPYRMYKISPKISKLLLPENVIFLPRKKPLFYSYSIQMLMLSRNRIEKLYSLTFSGMPNLEILYLDGNIIKCINYEPFLPVPALKYLHLGQNQIRDFPPKSLISQNLLYYIIGDQRRSKMNFVCEINELEFSKLI